MLAACRGRTEAVQVLLNSGADVNLPDPETPNNRYTALDYAICYGHTRECVELLVKKGATANFFEEIAGGRRRRTDHLRPTCQDLIPEP
mmetsp:Transcript_18999/g.29677  ORF Transcript_18999/g.29677 Transcript_18999/m.29677 type:complete len:89 (-) Transcript_18999:334-600(-)